MLKVIIDIFLYILALYGAIALIMGVFNSLKTEAYRKNGQTRLVLMVKNQEETIEGSVRSLLSEDILYKTISTGKLIILDMGSSDKTLEILEKLKNDFEQLDVIKETEKEKIFTYFDTDKNKERNCLAEKSCT